MTGITFLDPGSFRHRLLLEHAIHVSDDMGGSNVTWQELRLVWAHLEPVRADMRESAMQTNETVSHRIYLRQGGSIDTAMRFRKGTRIFQIDTLHDPDETGRYWLVMVREETGS